MNYKKENKTLSVIEKYRKWIIDARSCWEGVHAPCSRNPETKKKIKSRNWWKDKKRKVIFEAKLNKKFKSEVAKIKK